MKFQDIAKTVVDILIKGVVPLIFTLSLIMFLFGILKYLTAGGDEAKIGKGIQMMTYGAVALFVMFAVWGLVSLIVPFFGGSVVIPQF